ncbi:MAG: hypothetical protein JEY94_17375 [Melioribacteraceae bacterium]|nr:hypothetical protein [Melioribacteraceae bacterium]
MITKNPQVRFIHKIVFEECKQLSEGTTKNFQGSGLGLSITKRFMELLNGTIHIASEKDIGTSVVVKFPI